MAFKGSTFEINELPKNSSGNLNSVSHPQGFKGNTFSIDESPASLSTPLKEATSAIETSQKQSEEAKKIQSNIFLRAGAFIQEKVFPKIEKPIQPFLRYLKGEPTPGASEKVQEYEKLQETVIPTFLPPPNTKQSLEEGKHAEWLLNGMTLGYYRPKVLVWNDKTQKAEKAYNSQSGYDEKGNIITQKVEVDAMPQDIHDQASRIVGSAITYTFANSLLGGLISKIPFMKPLATKALLQPWTIGYPLAITTSGAIGAAIGGVSYAQDYKQRLKNVATTAGWYMLFTAIAYPIQQIFKPVITKEGKVTLYPNPDTPRLINDITKEVEAGNPLYFRSPNNPDLYLKVTPYEATVGDAKGLAITSLQNVKDFSKVDFELFKENPSLLKQIINFVSGKGGPVIKVPLETPEINLLGAPGEGVPSEVVPTAGPTPTAEPTPIPPVTLSPTPPPVTSPPIITPEAQKPISKAVLPQKQVNISPETEVQPAPTKKLKLSAKEEFKVGDIIDTQGNSNMEGIATIRKIEGNSLYFTDAKGTDYSGMARSDVRRLINGGDWKRVTPKAQKEVVEGIPKELQPLAQEARKYGSAEEFVQSFGGIKGKAYRLWEDLQNKMNISKKNFPTEESISKEFPKEWNAIKEAEKIENINIERMIKTSGKFKLGVPADFADMYRKDLTDFYNQAVKGVKEVKLPPTIASKAQIWQKIQNLEDEIQKLVNKTGKTPLQLRQENNPEYMKLRERDIALTTQYNQAVKGIKPEVKPQVNPEALEKIYQNNKIKEEAKKEHFPVGASIKITTEGSIKQPITSKHASQLRVHFNEFKKKIEEIISPLYFYKDAPMELRNAIRIDVIGGLNKIYENRNKNQITLWGGLSEKDIASSIEIIKLRDQLARIKADKGNPEITLEEAQTALDNAEKSASPEALKSAETYRLLSGKYTQDLIDRGKLDSDELMEDYMRHYVVDYTPEWVFNKGIPARLRQPFRGYLKKAGQTTKDYRVDEDTILGQFLEIDHDNMIEDFIVEQSEKYDIKPKLSKEEKADVLGVNKETGKTKSIKPGRIYIYNEERYRGFNPAAPFGRVIFPTEEGVMALGKYRKTYLIPEGIYNTFRNFSERGNAIMFYTNKAVSYWKTMAILSHFTSFNINNMVGDTWMNLSQSPAPLKVLSEIPTSLNYLTNKKPSTYLKELDKFMKDNDVIEGTYIMAELPKIRKASNPISYILQKSQNFSQFREAILRVANASYLFKEMKKGNGPRLIKYYDYMGLKGLTESEALGKVARDILVDYKWTSKTFNRIIRGFTFPFGKWYFKGSETTWKFTARHWGRALLAFLGIPVIAALWNDRNKKTRELEKELSESTQDRIHFIIRENPDGSVRVLNTQFPQDALIGTKIFSIAVNQANLVVIGKKTIKEAAIDTLKHWGIKEVKGIAYLTNFFVRFIQGLVQQRDPYDNSSIYSMDPAKMGSAQKLREQILFFIKTTVPLVSVYIRDYTLGKPIDLTTKNYMDKLVGLGALGIYDVSKRDKIYLEGKEVEWEDIDKLKEIYGNELAILDKMEDRWIASDLYPEDFIKTDEYKKILEEMRNMYTKYVPEAKDIPLEDIASGLGERLTNRLGNSTDSAKKWYQIKLERAKTDEEKKELGAKYKVLRQQNMIDAINASSKTSKDIFQIYLKNR